MIAIYPKLLSQRITTQLIQHHQNKERCLCKNENHELKNVPAFDDHVYIPEDSELVSEIFVLLDEAVKNYLYSQEHTKINFTDSIMLTGFCVYRVTKGTELHFDSIYSANYLRYLGLSVFLNETSGGDFIFPQQNKVIPSDAGTLIIFPSFFTHPHLTTTCVGDRYMLRVDAVDKNRRIVKVTPNP